MKISACVITKNEEKNIARSILSYKDIVDEIIVVDSESTDDTVKIAESLGAVVYNRPWTDDFAAARNFAIDKANGDWIIVLDADEYFREGDDKKIRKLVDEAREKDCESVVLPHYQIDEGTSRFSGICYGERIFQNGSRTRYVNRIHEYLQHEGKSLRHMETDKVVVYHTGYDPGIIRDKIKRNIAILKAPDTVLTPEYFKHLYLAENYYALRMHKDSIIECDELMLRTDFDDIILNTGKGCKIYVYKISAMLGLDEEYEEREIGAVVDKAVKRFPAHPEIKYQQHLFLKKYNRIDDAIAAFHEALLLNDNYFDRYENMFGDMMDIKLAEVALLYDMKNDVLQAKDCFVKSLFINRDNIEILIELLLLLRDGGEEDALRLIEEIYDTGDQVQLQKIVQSAWIAGCNQVFSAYFLKLIKTQPTELVNDKNILCKVFLLQKNYSGILQMTENYKSDELSRRFNFISRLALDHQDIYDDEVDDEFVLAVISDLLQSDDKKTLDVLIDNIHRFNGMEVCKPSRSLSLATLFNRYKKHELSMRFFVEAAELFDDRTKRKECLVLAAKSAYYSGQLGTATELLDKAAMFSSPHDDHLDEEVRRWIKEAAEKFA